jgi:phosphoribosylaminoimidazolecarboxamide formyltransferase/IMP cyclohydrolase
MTPQSFNYFDETVYKESIADGQILRYGKTTSKGFFFGDDAIFNKVHGKNYHITICLM